MAADFSAEWKHLISAAIPFVEQRRKPTGGYGATRRLPATIEDTYYALHILRLAVSQAVPLAGPDPLHDPALRGWLAQARHSQRPGLRTIYQLLSSCRMMGLEPPEKDFLEMVLARLGAGPALPDWQAGLYIVTDFFSTEPRSFFRAEWAVNISRLPWRTVDEVWMRLALAHLLGEPALVPSADLAGWLQACQNGDGGFGFLPGTTSFIENGWYCLQAMSLLGVQPRDPDLARRFIARCQTGAGGFSRNGLAAPFLDATWTGLDSFRLLIG